MGVMLVYVRWLKATGLGFDPRVLHPLEQAVYRQVLAGLGKS
jgi:hypothetical protein